MSESLEEIRNKWEGDSEELERFRGEGKNLYVLCKRKREVKEDKYAMYKYFPKLDEGWNVDVKFVVTGSEKALIELFTDLGEIR